MNRIKYLLISSLILIAFGMAIAADVAGPSMTADMAMLSVKHFGAVGDGKADDTEAIQKALDNAGKADPNKPGATLPNIVFFPTGVYRVTKTLQMHPELKVAKLLGTGAMSSRLTKQGNSTLLWDGPEGGHLLNVAGYLSLRISEILFDGNNKADVLLRINSIKGVGTGLWYIERVNFINAGTGIECGADLDSCASDMTIVDCNFNQLKVAGFRTMAAQNVDYVFIRCIFTWVPIGVHFKKGGVGHFILPAFGRVRTGLKVDTGGVNCGVYTMTGLQMETFSYDSEKKRFTIAELGGGVHMAVTGIYTGAGNLWGEEGDPFTPNFILHEGCRVSVRDSNLTGKLAKLDGYKHWGATWIEFDNCTFSHTADPREDIEVDDHSGFEVRNSVLQVHHITSKDPVTTPGIFFVQRYTRLPKSATVINETYAPPAAGAPPAVAPTDPVKN